MEPSLAEFSAVWAYNPTEEIRAAISRRVSESHQQFRVIPVLLPGVEKPERSRLPSFLVAATWVEFRDSLDDPDAFHRLVCGIRGVEPGPGKRSPAAAHCIIHNLPFAPNPAFTGRETDLKNLDECLQKHGEVALTQTVALHGLGGVGKTQLAVEYAWKHLGGYTAVLWVRADNPEALDANLAGLAGVLGLPETSAQEQGVQVEAVLSWLKGNKRWLLLADNADTDVAITAVRDRFPPHLGGHVLVTSRIGHWPVNMAHLPLELLSSNDAARYLQERAAAEGYHAGDDVAARQLAEELGNLPLALEQAASFIIETRWSFAHYQTQLRNARRELLSEHREGATRYPTSVAETWRVTLERLSPLARTLLRIVAWFAPEAVPQSIFRADHRILSEALDRDVTTPDLAIPKALVELARFSLIRLTPGTVSVHRLLQAVEQDALTQEECARWLEWTVRLFNAFAPEKPHDVRTWDVWLPLRPHAEALIEHTQKRGVNTRPVGLIASLFGIFLSARAEYAEAEPLYRRALAIEEKVLGPDHPEVASDLNNLALLLWDTNRASEAEPLYRRALAIAEISLGPNHPEVGRALNNLAQLLQASNRLQEAESLMRRALAIGEKTLGPDDPDVASALNNLAALLKASNRLQEAEPLYRRALAIDERILGPDHPDLAIDLNNLAMLLRATNRHTEAKPLSRRQLEIFLRFTVTTGHKHPYLHAAIANYVVLLEEMGSSPAQIRVQLDEIGHPFGMRLGSGEQGQ